MPNTLTINPDVLQHYINNAEMPYELLQEKCKYIDLFLSGEKQPTFNQLSDVAKRLNIPTGLLLLPTPINIETSKLEFRTIGSSEIGRMSDNLRDTIVDMEKKQDFLREMVETELSFGSVVMGGIGSVAGGVVSEDINSWQDVAWSFGLGGVAGGVGFGVGRFFNMRHANAAWVSSSEQVKRQAIRELGIPGDILNITRVLMNLDVIENAFAQLARNGVNTSSRQALNQLIRILPTSGFAISIAALSAALGEGIDISGDWLRGLFENSGIENLRFENLCLE